MPPPACFKFKFKNEKARMAYKRVFYPTKLQRIFDIIRKSLGIYEYPPDL